MPAPRKNAAAAAQQPAQPDRFAPPEQPLQPDSAEIAHLIHLSADVIDALPPSLTRSLSDLKELDAVLNSSILAINSKLNKLNNMLAAPADAFTPQQRLELLKEVAEDANLFKLGGEDKIRVATGACETIIQHTSQLDLITSLMTSMMPPHLLENLPASSNPAGYPHLFPPYATANHHSPRKQDFFPPPHVPTRQAAQAYSNALSQVQMTQREVPSLKQPRPATRITSAHAPPQERTNSGKKREAPSGPASPVIATAQPAKRARKPVQQEDKMDLDSASNSSKGEKDDPIDRSANASPAPSISSQRGVKRKKEEGAPSPVPGKRRGNNGGGRKAAPRRKSSMMDEEEDGDFAGDAGVNTAGPEEAVEEVVTEVVEPPAADDPNEPKYCYCQRVSYGEMIGCDNQDCKMEWFHLGCIGLPAVPKGTWYCDECSIAMQQAPKRRKMK